MNEAIKRQRVTTARNVEALAANAYDAGYADGKADALKAMRKFLGQAKPPPEPEDDEDDEPVDPGNAGVDGEDAPEPEPEPEPPKQFGGPAPEFRRCAECRRLIDTARGLRG